MKTSVPLRKAIILELRAWRNNTEAPSLAFADPQLHAAIKSQSMIGWRGFLEGLIVKDILEYQKEFLARHFPERNSSSWNNKLYKLGWNIIMDLWTHRNENLHKSENIDILNGKEILEETIKKELAIGLGNLPPPLNSPISFELQQQK